MRVRSAGQLLSLLLLFFAIDLRASSHKEHQVNKTSPLAVPAVLLSDPHFDPFRDPTKVKRLDAAPVSEWESILSEPATGGAPERYAALQTECGARGLDTEHDLLQSSFAAASSGMGQRPAFVLLAGDLLVHQFDCRYKHLMGNSPESLERFAQKTINYVVLQLAAHFPQAPVYVALGNNDSGCGDYQFDPAGTFLSGTAGAVRQGWHNADKKDTDEAEAAYRRLGSYSLRMPAPMQRTRVVVLDDIFLSSTYRGCDGQPHPERAAALLTWLEETLSAAKRDGEQVWVLTHIPPGVNVYSTFLHSANICDGGAPAMFLFSEHAADVLTKYATTIRVIVAGHTHVDEMHVIGEDEAPEQRVAIKSVPSITPLSGNGPAFLTATVDPVSAKLLDYKLQQANAESGPHIAWHESYDYAKTYGEQEFDPAAVAHLVQRFDSADPADAAVVNNYQQHYTTGLKRLALQAVWPQYVCSMHHDTARGFAGCSCPAK